MNPLYFVLPMLLLPVAVGLILRRLSRKTDYVGQWQQKNEVLNQRLIKLKQRAGDNPVRSVKPLINMADYFLGMSNTALEFSNVRRSDVHQQLVKAILWVTEGLVAGDIESNPIVEKLVIVLHLFKEKKLETARAELMVMFVDEPGLQIRSLGLSCLVWLERSQGKHENADQTQYLLDGLPAKMAEAGL